MPSYVRAGIRKCARIRALSSYLEKIFNDDWMRENGYGDIVERTSRPSLAEQYL